MLAHVSIRESEESDTRGSTGLVPSITRRLEAVCCRNSRLRIVGPRLEGTSGAGNTSLHLAIVGPRLAMW